MVSMGAGLSVTCRERLLGSVSPQRRVYSFESSHCFSADPSFHLVNIPKCASEGTYQHPKMDTSICSRIKVSPFPLAHI